MYNLNWVTPNSTINDILSTISKCAPRGPTLRDPTVWGPGTVRTLQLDVGSRRTPKLLVPKYCSPLLCLEPRAESCCPRKLGQVGVARHVSKSNAVCQRLAATLRRQKMLPKVCFIYSWIGENYIRDICFLKQGRLADDRFNQMTVVAEVDIRPI